MEIGTVHFLIGLALALGIGVKYGFDIIYEDKFLAKFKAYREALKRNMYFSIRNLFMQEMQRAEGTLTDEELDSKINGFIKEWTDYQEIKDLYDWISKTRIKFLMVFLLSAAIFIGYLFNPNMLYGSLDGIGAGGLLFALGFLIMVWFIIKVSELQGRMSKYELGKKSFDEIREEIKGRVSKSGKN